MPKGSGYVGRVYIHFQMCVHGPVDVAGLDVRVLLSAGFKLSMEFPCSLCHALDDQDEVVLIAIRALGDMRSSAVAHAHAPYAEGIAATAKAHSRTC